MNLRKIVPLLATLLAGAVFIGRAEAEPPVAATLAESSEVLSAMEALPTRSIPPTLLSDAQGIAIIPRVIKAGFVVGGRIGHGVVFSKNADGSWSGPTFVHVGGASIGFQAGVQSTDMVLVFKTRNSLDRVVRGKGKLTLGADAAIAAGPVGREAQAGTDARLRAEIFSYSRSRGLFAGVSFEGAAVTYDDRANGEYQTSPPEVQAWAGKLAGQIIAASKPREVAPGMVAPIPPPPAVPAPIPPPPPPVVPMPLPAVPRP